MKDISMIQDWLDRCLNEGRNLTQWEQDFIVSIADRLNRVGSLSEKQREILERIYTERVP